jgi:hypothetical protein
MTPPALAHAARVSEDTFNNAKAWTEDTKTPSPRVIRPLGVYSQLQLFTRGAIG